MTEGAVGRSSLDGSKRWCFIGIIAGLTVVIGAFLAWIQLSGNVVLQVVSLPASVAGTRSTEGLIALGAGVVVVSIGAAGLRARRGFGGVLMVLAALTILGAATSHVASSLEERYVDDAVTRSARVEVSAEEIRAELEPALVGGGPDFTSGLGWYLTTAGGVVALLAGIALVLRRATPVSAKDTRPTRVEAADPHDSGTAVRATSSADELVERS